MANLFRKAAIFTDLHLGLKSNSDIHNNDCLAFTEWMIQRAKSEGCETCFFLGDYHNNRASMNVKTMSYAVKILELIGKAFSQTFFIPGNHDYYFREKRDVLSAEWARHIPNIHVVNDFFKEGDVSIVPWLVKDEHKKIQKINAQYMFGHFELPHFFMNAMVQMPDHGEIKREDLGHIGQVFSGHFHKRQTSNNITYIGNCFPHNYADAGDDDRGMMVLEWGKEPEFHSWPEQPKYRVYKLSQVLNDTDNLLKDRMHVRVNLDVDISYEEANFIKETFIDTYKLRELTLIPVKFNAMEQEATLGDITFESVDQIVTGQISAISSEHYDPKLLLEIYRNL